MTMSHLYLEDAIVLPTRNSPRCCSSAEGKAQAEGKGLHLLDVALRVG